MKRGEKMSEELKLKMSNAHRGKPKSESSKQKLIETWSHKRRMKNIVQIDTQDENISTEICIDIKTNGGNMIQHKIADKYNMKKTTFGNCVVECYFTLKTDERQSISVIFKRSKIDGEPLVLCSNDFIDDCFKNDFIAIAKNYIPNYFSIKITGVDIDEARENYKACHLAEMKKC